MLPNLLTQPLAYGVPVESSQRAPKLEVFTPFYEGGSAATVLRNRALKIHYRLLQHRRRQSPHPVIVEHRQAARSARSR
jgi:hypothetical protein